MMALQIIVEAADVTGFLADYDDVTRGNLVKALNKTADKARTMSAEEVRNQVNLPASYLSPSQGRLKVSTRANKQSLEAIVSGRNRPTSLARFVVGAPPVSGQRTKGGKLRKPKGGKITVEVKPGRRAALSRAFLVSIPGAVDSRNLGLAVRTEGGPPPGAYAPKQLGENVWLVYGPSVGQVLSSVNNAGGVYEEISAKTMQFLQDEFLRLQNLSER